ncbi:MAG: TetR/AcrR family transcriptional regulator [Parvularculaceae bacterium]|nr:MAG: TetR/AcrR family transcriptional regulator [Parvularculaceae bacterium]
MTSSTKNGQISRRTRKKQETRARILKSAIRLFGERGYDNVKIEEIANAADIANATFFLHFPTKAALVSAFNEELSASISARIKDFEIGAVEKLEIIRALVLDEYSRHAELLRRIVVDVAAQGGQAFAESSESLTDLVSGVIREGQSENNLSTAFDADIAAECLVASWRAATLHWAQTGDAERAQRANRQALDLILFGLANIDDPALK